MRPCSTSGRWSRRSSAQGGTARLTEYRGVGHNSWDRAYNNPELIDWMLAQQK